MSFDITNIVDRRRLLVKFENEEDSIFLAPVDGKITVVSEGRFKALDDAEKIELVEKLRLVSSDKDTPAYKKTHVFACKEARKKIDALRNEILSSIDSHGHINMVPRDILELGILGRTSPKDVANAASVSKGFRRVATFKAQILSVNANQFCLRDVLPPSVKTAEEAVAWVTKDKITCQMLEYADLKGFEDLTEKDLNELVVSCPNLKHLAIKSKEIRNIEALPSDLVNLDCSDSTGLRLLPALPETLETLKLNVCIKLNKLPDLPSLTTLEIGGCLGLHELPSLPVTLKLLTMRSCYGLTDVVIKVPEGCQVKK